MSIRIMTAVWEMDLPAKSKLVLLALADCANDEGTAWPSIATIARKCGCDERTVQRNLRDLQESKIIAREEVRGKGCKYHFVPRHIVTPVKSSPVTNRPKTPVKSPPKPSRTVNTKDKRAIPANWQPEEFGEGTESKVIVDSWTPQEHRRHAEQFMAHHTAARSRFSCWQAAWSKWVLNSEKFKPRAPPPTRGGSMADIGNEVRQLYGF